MAASGTMEASLKDVPEELQDTEQWVAYNEYKEPINPHTGELADTTDSTTWGTFEEAVGRAEEEGLPGVGFVFTADDTFAGVDLDKCVDPDTGEVHPEAQKIVEDHASYAEVSPSGTGIKIFCHAVKPGERCRTKETPWGGEIEVYDAGRFFTVTGEHLEGTPLKVAKSQKAFKELYGRVFGSESAGTPVDPEGRAPLPPPNVDADKVIEKARAAKNGDEFRRLMYEEPDPKRLSEDDMSLAFRTVFYTGGDADLAEEVMRRSVRVRDKWGTRRGNTTWIRQRIQKAMNRIDNFYEWPGSSKCPASPSLSREGHSGHLAPIPAVNLKHGFQAAGRDALRAVSFGTLGRPEPVEWLVGNHVPAGLPSMVYGMGGDGKSLVVLDMAMHLAAGRESWHGLRIAPDRVLYLDFELNHLVQGNRAYDLATGMGLDAPPDDLLYMSALDATDPAAAFGAALDTCLDRDVKLVIVDSVGAAIEGDSEASKDVLGFLNTRVKPFSAAGVAVLMVDHQAKVIKGEKAGDKLPFGSVYKFNMCRSVFQVQGDQDPEGLTVKLKHKKTNLGRKQDDLALRLSFAAGRIGVEKVRDFAFMEKIEEMSARHKTRRALEGGPMYPDEISKETGLALKTVKNQLTQLRNEGVVEDTGEKDKQACQVRLTRAGPGRPKARNLGTDTEGDD